MTSSSREFGLSPQLSSRPASPRRYLPVSFPAANGAHAGTA